MRAAAAAALVTDPLLAHCAIVITGMVGADSGPDDVFRTATRAGDSAAPLFVAVGDGQVPALG